MRVTNDMVSRRVLNDITANMIKMQKSQSQISSGKRISTPSDDPKGVAKTLSYRSDKYSLEQYQENISSANEWLNTTTEKLTSAEDLIMKILDLGYEGTNGMMEADSKQGLADQIDQYLQEMLDIANSKLGNRNVFGGVQTLTNPFTAVDTDLDGYIDRVNPNPSGISGEIEREIGKGQTLVVNSPGDEVFQPGGVAATGDIFDAIIKLRDALSSGAASSEIQNQVTRLENDLTNIINCNAVVGAKLNRLETSDVRLEAEILNDTSNISNIEDVDIAEATLKYETQKNMLQASLQIGSQIISMSLVDFLA